MFNLYLRKISKKKIVYDLRKKIQKLFTHEENINIPHFGHEDVTFKLSVLKKKWFSKSKDSFGISQLIEYWHGESSHHSKWQKCTYKEEGVTIHFILF